jgi:hypothetical protein
MHPQTHYGHFVAAVELFTGIFSMSLMTGLIFARFSRPNARLLFADRPVITNHDGKPTLMLRLANERHNIISNATAKLWLFKNIVSMEGETLRRFYELPLTQSQNPGLALSWTLYHILDENSRSIRPMQPTLRYPRLRLRLWCPDMMLLRRKPSTPESPTNTAIFVLGTALSISSIPRMTVA